MEASISATLATTLSNFTGSALNQLPIILAVGAPVLVSVSGVFFAIKALRGMIHI